MNSSKQLIQGATRMKNLMRPGPMEMRQAMPHPPVPPPLAQARPIQSATPPPAGRFAPDPLPPRRSVYNDLMKKHDSLNPRIKL